MMRNQSTERAAQSDLQWLHQLRGNAQLGIYRCLIIAGSG